MLRPGRSLPLKGFRHWAPTPSVSPRRRQSATRRPGAYRDRTSTGTADASLCPDQITNGITSEQVGTRINHLGGAGR